VFGKSCKKDFSPEKELLNTEPATLNPLLNGLCVNADDDAKHLAKETVAHLHDDGHSVRLSELPGNFNPSARLFHLRSVTLNVKLQPLHLQHLQSEA